MCDPPAVCGEKLPGRRHKVSVRKPANTRPERSAHGPGKEIAAGARTARRYRTIQIQAGVHTITAADPYPTTSAKPSTASMAGLGRTWPNSGSAGSAPYGRGRPMSPYREDSSATSSRRARRHGLAVEQPRAALATSSHTEPQLRPRSHRGGPAGTMRSDGQSYRSLTMVFHKGP